MNGKYGRQFIGHSVDAALAQRHSHLEGHQPALYQFWQTGWDEMYNMSKTSFFIFEVIGRVVDLISML
jgi:hypothetical protein